MTKDESSPSNNTDNNSNKSPPNLIDHLRKLILEEDARISKGVYDPSTESSDEFIMEPMKLEKLVTEFNDDYTPLMHLESLETPNCFRPNIVRHKRWTQKTLQEQKIIAEDELLRLQGLNSGHIINERIMVLDEILESERSYVGFLELLYKMYYGPICEGTEDPYLRDEFDEHGVDIEDRDNIFPPNLCTILKFNKAFLGKLEERRILYEGLPYFMTIGDIYSEMAPFLKVYVSYVTNYERCVTFIRKYRQICPQFDQWLERRKKHADSNGLDITSLMIMPVQRVPRYRILLDALLDKTDKEHADRYLLEEARDAVSNIAEYQNGKIRQAKNLRRVYQLSKRLKLKDLVSPSRRIIREGKVEVHKCQCIAYLFNDLLVLEQEDRRGLQPQCEVFSLLDSFISGGNEFGITIRISEQTEFGEKTSVVELVAKTHVEKQRWHDELLRVLSGLNERENDQIIRHVDMSANNVSTAPRKTKNGSLRDKLRLSLDKVKPIEIPNGQFTPRGSNKRLSLSMLRKRSEIDPSTVSTPTLTNNSPIIDGE